MDLDVWLTSMPQFHLLRNILIQNFSQLERIDIFHALISPTLKLKLNSMSSYLATGRLLATTQLHFKDLLLRLITQQMHHTRIQVFSINSYQEKLEISMYSTKLICCPLIFIALLQDNTTQQLQVPPKFTGYIF